jgi:hypothetical protein
MGSASKNIQQKLAKIMQEGQENKRNHLLFRESLPAATHVVLYLCNLHGVDHFRTGPKE